MLRQDIPEERSTFTRTPTRKGRVDQISMKIAAPLDGTCETTIRPQTQTVREPVTPARRRPFRHRIEVLDHSPHNNAMIPTVTP
jgi:hypothetical protein